MPRVKFAWSLLAVFVGSLATIVPIMWLLESVGLEMRAMKRAQPNLLLSEIVTYIASPVIAAVAIAVLRRVLASQKKNAEQSLAAESR
jgi:LytS/YehU family sensor histidine kinase